jgi:hypothetical protein
MTEFNQNLTLEELKSIIHGLRMSGFSFVEQEALPQIQFRIKNLPVTEELDKLADDPVSIRNIVGEIGELMRLLNIYGNKNSEYKVRFQSLKGLPPRYKVLEWRDVKMNEKAANLVKELIKMSSAMDEQGKSEISKKLIVCAKHAIDDRFTNEDISIMKEAGITDWIKQKLNKDPFSQQVATPLKEQEKKERLEKKEKLEGQRGSFNTAYKALQQIALLDPEKEVSYDDVSKMVKTLPEEFQGAYANSLNDLYQSVITVYKAVPAIAEIAKKQQADLAQQYGAPAKVRPEQDLTPEQKKLATQQMNNIGIEKWTPEIVNEVLRQLKLSTASSKVSENKRYAQSTVLPQNIQTLIQYIKRNPQLLKEFTSKVEERYKVLNPSTEEKSKVLDPSTEVSNEKIPGTIPEASPPTPVPAAHSPEATFGKAIPETEIKTPSATPVPATSGPIPQGVKRLKPRPAPAAHSPEATFGKVLQEASSKTFKIIRIGKKL